MLESQEQINALVREAGKRGITYGKLVQELSPGQMEELYGRYERELQGRRKKKKKG